jgi:hypothetical protein
VDTLAPLRGKIIEFVVILLHTSVVNTPVVGRKHWKNNILPF